MENTDFTPRMKQIILALLANQGPVPVQRLAEQVHISKRTVQRELEYFPRALKNTILPFVQRPEPESGWRGAAEAGNV